MIDFSRFEDRLNSDVNFRQAFLHDPAGVLLREGVTLSERNRRALTTSRRGRPTQPGGGVGAGDAQKVVVRVTFEYGGFEYGGFEYGGFEYG